MSKNRCAQYPTREEWLAVRSTLCGAAFNKSRIHYLFVSTHRGHVTRKQRKGGGVGTGMVYRKHKE
jgi:hypothetical protein